MKITLVRHAEVQTEYIGKYNGHIDIALSEHGKSQAQRVAKELTSENFDVIYCSDLLRARQTLDAFTYTPTPVYTKALREKSWGIHEGKNFQEIEKSGIIYKNFSQWLEALDGQSIQSYQEQVEDFYENILLKSDAHNVLIVTHSGFIKTLLGVLNNTPLEKSFSILFPYASYIQFSKL